MANKFNANQSFRVIFGGWYQRTTLHLTEIYDLLSRGYSDLDLDKNKLESFKKSLDLETIKREAGYLEFITARTKSGIEIRYYEDGLYILETESDNIKKAQKILEDYYNNILSPAVSYIFSLGAPTPKILANIKTIHPTAVSFVSDNPSKFEIDEKEFGKSYSKIASEEIIVYKTPEHIILVFKPDFAKSAEDIVEMQIFFREFKDQLQKYLNIHRNIWEEISDIKEKQSIRGTKVEEIRSKLDGYQKTISLISNRINQMGTYIRTRSNAAKNLKIETQLVSLFQFKFEILADTLEYIKEIWKMTMDYLISAVQNIVEIKNQSTARGIQSLQFITSLGVISTIFGYLGRNELPRVVANGVIYFGLIIMTASIINLVVAKIYKNKKYKLKFGERVKNI